MSPFSKNIDNDKIPSPLERVRVRHKICGMKYPDNILEVASLQPDYLGFIFYEKSPRYLDGVIPKLPASIKKVGVFVDENSSELIIKASKYKLYAVQLHGNESVEYCKEIRRAELYSITENQTKKKWQGSEIKIIKVFSIDEAFNFNQLEPYESVCDYYLFDTKGKLPGGNGYVFNWDVLKNYTSSKPYFLSGGIGLNEIETLKEFLKTPASQYCHAIDINSQFEVEAGLKAIDKINEFKRLLT